MRKRFYRLKIRESRKVALLAREVFRKEGKGRMVAFLLTKNRRMFYEKVLHLDGERDMDLLMNQVRPNEVKRVVVVCRHLSEDVMPTEKELLFASLVEDGLRKKKIRLVDYISVAEKGYFSLANRIGELY